MKKILAILGAFFFIGAPNEMAWAARIVITGSTTVQPIAEKGAKLYRKSNRGVTVEVRGGGSGNGVKAIIDGTTDIGNASRFIKDKELQYAHGKGVYPIPFQIAYDCIIPIVHPGNGVRDLTLAQLRKIYIGEVNNWRSLGGGDLPIRVISRDTSSGTYEIWEKKVMNNQDVFPGAKLAASNADVLKTVASDIHAVGYIGLGYLSKSVQSIRVDGIEGSIKTTLDGTYPLSRPLYMFTRGWPRGETLKFINFMLNPFAGQKAVVECGFVALYENITDANQRDPASANAYQYLPETSVNIQRIQKYLNVLGYHAGLEDGIKGEQTVSAMLAFQKQSGLPLEWRISNEMVSALSNRYLKWVDNP